MTSQTSTTMRWRRTATGALATGALAAGLMIGVGGQVASADPVDPNGTSADTPAPAAPAMTADQALAIIDSEYDTGQGGGQLSNLIHEVLKLRALGYMPSKGNRESIEAALDKRPNQAPLIAALNETLSYQRRNQMRAAAQAPQQQPAITPPTIGGGPQPGGNMPGFGIDPNAGGTVNLPLG
jgi:hypothetical protein